MSRRPLRTLRGLAAAALGCALLRAAFSDDELLLTVQARGDGSLGPLQAPHSSVLRVGGAAVRPSSLALSRKNSELAIDGTLGFRLWPGARGRATFAYGAEGGGWLVDTPGMRELQLSDAAAGVAEVFNDIAAMTLECRFSNCTHSAEPDCAVQTAIANGSLERIRLDRWRKLTAEEITNTAKLAPRRTRAEKPNKRI